MADFAIPLLVAVFVWWFGTGLVLLLDGLPRHTFRWSMLGATLVLAIAVYGIAATRTDATPLGAYVAFVCGVLIWGWIELAFLTGLITGPRKTGCDPHCSGISHFGHAIQAILYHEFAILLAGAVIIALTLDQPNQVGLGTFAILWIMRQSAKLNLYFGVPNLSENLLPDHLAHLTSYFRRRPMNLLFPVSITGATALTAMLVERSFDAAPGSFEFVANALLATLAGLAVIEHWLLVVPLPVEALWAWGLRKRTAPSRRTAHDHAPLESAAVRSAGDLS